MSAAGLPTRLRDSARRVAPLAWPVFVGQIAVLAFTTVDTVLIGRYAADDLAALALGAATYVTVFIGLMGVVQAVGPIAAQLYGAGRPAEAGRQLHQAAWIAVALSVLGGALLLMPEPFLALSHTPPAIEPKVRAYLGGLAPALPAALLFAAYRSFGIAVARPRAIMVLQLGALVLKVPLAALLVWGLPWGAVQPMGVAGCAVSTSLVMVLQVFGALWVLKRDPFYAPFALFGRGLPAPHRAALAAQLRLGVPMGLSILVDVTGFTFMALFIGRIGPTAVAGHQIAANLVALLYMMPLSLGSAVGAVVAQRIGAGDLDDARRLGWHGLQLAIGLALAMGGAVWLARGAVVRLYSVDEPVVAAALPLVAWILVFHVADATQAVAAFVLRAWRIATLPMLIYAGSLWGLGLGGGYALAFDPLGIAPAALRGAPGFWAAATAGLTAAAATLALLLYLTLRRLARSPKGGTVPAA